MAEHTFGFRTRALHAGGTPDAEHGARAVPIYQTTSFVFKDTDDAANLFSLQKYGNVYSRLSNPTVAALEERIASLEGGIGAVATASGMAAEFITFAALCQAGDHIVASSQLYGGTVTQLDVSLRRFGIETTFVEDPDNLDEWRAAVRPNTKLFFGETVPNPRNDVLDIEPIAQIAHEAGVPLIVDNTVPTPYLVRPIEFGADVVVHSATKYLGGHGTSIGGVIVDSGNFDYGADPKKFPKFNEPAPSYHGLVYARDLGKDSAFGANLSYILKARVSLLRDTGAAISPTNAFNIGIGLETLSLRIERHIENATKVANWLEEHPLVDRVIWAGLPSSPWYERAQKYLPKGPGAVVGFTLKDADLEQTRTFVDALQLHSNVANIGDVRSLVIHPASTTHAQLSTEELEKIGVYPNFVRLAVGIENIDDILADLQLGFDTLS